MIWEPRYYYVLQNKTTNKLYVGQTKQDIKTYLGSGAYWNNHCKKYGGKTRENIEIVWSYWFESESEARYWLDCFEVENPSYYSSENKIWANEIPEDTNDNPRPMLDPEVVVRKVANTDYSTITEKRMSKMDYSKSTAKMKATKNSTEWKAVGKAAAKKRLQKQDTKKTGMSISKTFTDEQWLEETGNGMRKKQKSVMKEKRNREIVHQIKELQSKLNVKLGTGWTTKSDEDLQEIKNKLENMV